MHITSAALAGTGVLMIFSALYEGIHARHTAEKALLGMEKNPSTLVSKDEFAVVDDLRIIAFFAIIIGASLIGLAKIGCMSSWKKNVTFTNLNYKRSLVRSAFVIILAFIVRYYVDDMKIKITVHRAKVILQSQNQTEIKFSNKTEIQLLKTKVKKYESKSESSDASKAAFETYVHKVLE